MTTIIVCFALILALCSLQSRTATANSNNVLVCKFDPNTGKCGETQINRNLLKVAMRWTGLKEGSCAQWGYAIPTDEVFQIKTPVGTMSTPVFLKGEVTNDIQSIKKSFRNANNMIKNQLYKNRLKDRERTSLVNDRLNLEGKKSLTRGPRRKAHKGRPSSLPSSTVMSGENIRRAPQRPQKRQYLTELKRRQNSRVTVKWEKSKFIIVR